MVFNVLLRLAQIKIMLLLLFLFIPIHVPLENVVGETTSVKRIKWWHISFEKATTKNSVGYPIQDLKHTQYLHVRPLTVNL